MINTQRELQREIHAVQQKLSNEEVFISPAYEHKLTEMGHGITNCTFDGKSHMFNHGDDIAYTDGNDIYINYASPTASSLEARTDKHQYFLGLNLHEYGHILFTDFHLAEKVRNELKADKLYPMPKENDYLKELLEFLADESKNSAALQGIHHSLDNCIEDGFVDRATCTAIPGYADCLRYVNTVDIGTFNTYKEMKEKNIPNPLIFTNLTLGYCVYGQKGYSDEEIENDDLLEAFEGCLSWLRKAVYETRPLERKRYVNTVFCHLFHFIKQEAEKQQQEQQSKSQEQNQQSEKQETSSQQSNNQQEQSTSGNSTSSQSSSNLGKQETGTGMSPTQALNNALNALNDNMQSTEKTEHRNAKSPNSNAINEISSNMQAEQNGSDTSETESSANKQESQPGNSSDATNELSTQLDKIAQEIAVSQIYEKQENEIRSENACNVKKFLDGVQIHHGINCNVTRAECTTDATTRYNSYHHELDSIVRRFIKDFEKEIKERQLGDTLTGLYAGKRLDSNHLYRSDKRLFSRKIMPEDIPDMAVGILIDCSGSMSGDRIEIARQCAYITYSFCQKMHIPCFVFGHNTAGWDVKLKSVADEKSLDNKDSIRIFGLEAGGANRDGFALRYCLKKLEQIQAQDRLMLIISDGKPAHQGYGMQSGQIDCQSAVHDAIKKGIYTIAAGLGYDAPSVYEVYKEGRSDKDSATFLDISDMNRMPKAFIKIIKKRLEHAT